MPWIARTTAVVTMIAVVFHGLLPTMAASEAAIEGTVEIPCDPSRVGEVVLIQIRSVSGGSAATAVVDSSTGTFVIEGLTEGEYELIAIGADSRPLSPEPKRLLLREGSNTVVLSVQPPGCGEQDSDRDGVSDAVDSCPNSPPGTAVGADGCPLQGKNKPGKKDGLEDWHLTLIYFGVVGAIAVALGEGDEKRASPVQP